MGRRHVLTNTKRKMIISLVANGSSRRVAAQYVGCAPSTITRTVRRIPEFAEELVRAEQLNEITLLRNIKNAAQNPRYWRAAAWLLERTNTDDFVIKEKEAITPEKVREFIGHFIENVLCELPERYRKIVVKRVYSINQQLTTPPPMIIIEPVNETEPDDGDAPLLDDFTRAAHASQNSGNPCQSRQTPPKLQQAAQR